MTDMTSVEFSSTFNDKNDEGVRGCFRSVWRSKFRLTNVSDLCLFIWQRNEGAKRGNWSFPSSGMQRKVLINLSAFHLKKKERKKCSLNIYSIRSCRHIFWQFRWWWWSSSFNEVMSLMDLSRRKTIECSFSSSSCLVIKFVQLIDWTE